MPTFCQGYGILKRSPLGPSAISPKGGKWHGVEKPKTEQPTMGPGDFGLWEAVCCKTQGSLGAVCYGSQIRNPAHRETKGAKGNFIFNEWSPVLHPLKGWNTSEEPKSKPSELNPEENYCSPSPWGGRFTPDVNDRCQAFSAQQTREINNGRLTRRESFSQG